MAASALPCAVRLRRAARRGAARLSDEACRCVFGYVNAQRGLDGGYMGRHGATDLYYSFFALACLEALDQSVDWGRTAPYLDSFGDGHELDLAHFACLARSWTLVPEGRARAATMAAHLEAFVASDGGYRPTLVSGTGSIAASFVAQLAYEELNQPVPEAARVEECIAGRDCADGSWADVPGLSSGTTTVTAAVALMRAAQGQAETAGASWLAARRTAGGGYLSSPAAPMPDLLSTAAALVALDAVGGTGRASEDTSCFVESLWNDDGGFRGYVADPKSDCEFTYYALVSLGALEDARV